MVICNFSQREQARAFAPGKNYTFGHCHVWDFIRSGFHHLGLSLYHRTVSAKPSFHFTFGLQPNFLILDESSKYLESWPGRSGTVRFNVFGLLRTFNTSSAILVTVFSKPVPIL